VPIRFRLALSFAAVTLVLVVVGGVAFARSFRGGLESSLEPGLRTQADVLGQRLRAGLQPTEAANGGAIVVRTQDVVTQVLDSESRVLATTREAGRVPVVPSGVIHSARVRGVVTDVSIGGEREPYRVLARPVSTTDGRRIVVVATSLEATNAAVSRVNRALLVGGAAAIVVAGVGGWLLATAALRPVERMRRRAADISERDFAAGLPVPATRDEIAALATTMNALLGRLHAALERQRAFVADASHELRTPLAVLQTEFELARQPRRSRVQLEDAIEHAADEVARLAHVTDDLLFLARRDGSSRVATEPTRLAPVLQQAITATRSAAEHRQVRIELEGDPSMQVCVAPGLLRQAAANLLGNAIRYSAPRGTVRVRVHRSGDGVVIEVLDTGPGFPPDFLPDAFERFRRADDVRSRADGGTGLGLAIVLAVADAHGGTVEAVNRPEGGACVRMCLPATRDAGMGGAPPTM